jgi:hypothetical protein
VHNGDENPPDEARVLAMNSSVRNSEAFGPGTLGQWDILVPYTHDGKQWIVSLYSDKMDVSEIAKRHGGGGHKGAAGFVCSELPFSPAASTV